MIEFCTTRYFLSLRDSYSYAVYSQAVPTSLPHSCIRCADSRKGENAIDIIEKANANKYSILLTLRLLNPMT